MFAGSILLILIAAVLVWRLAPMVTIWVHNDALKSNKKVKEEKKQ